MGARNQTGFKMKLDQIMKRVSPWACLPAEQLFITKTFRLTTHSLVWSEAGQAACCSALLTCWLLPCSREKQGEDAAAITLQAQLCLTAEGGSRFPPFSVSHSLKVITNESGWERDRHLISSSSTITAIISICSSSIDLLWRKSAEERFKSEFNTANATQFFTMILPSLSVLV